MAYTVTQSFRDYASNLNVTDKQESTVSTCRSNIVKVIGEKLTLHSEQNSKLIGSYDRDTLIRYLKENDVDVMVILHYTQNKDWYTSEGTVNALSRFKSILQAKYQETPMSIDRNAVTMKLSQFSVDVVPAFKWEDGTYRIPDTHRMSWLVTDPKGFADKITLVNKTMDGTFVPLIKMVKGWNREQGFPIRSFHLECMLYHHYKSYSESYTYPSTLHVFFSRLPEYLEVACYDPVTNDRVDGYLDNNGTPTKRSIAITKANKAKDISSKAVAFEESYPDDHELAINEWKGLFGEFFPTYG